jgi:hypothetical protein
METPLTRSKAGAGLQPTNKVLLTGEGFGSIIQANSSGFPSGEAMVDCNSSGRYGVVIQDLMFDGNT